MTVKLELSFQKDLDLEITGDSVQVESAKVYKGPYDVVPTLGGFDMETAGFLMSDDVTVEPIPIAQATNPAGGYTFVIG